MKGCPQEFPCLPPTPPLTRICAHSLVKLAYIYYETINSFLRTYLTERVNNPITMLLSAQLPCPYESHRISSADRRYLFLNDWGRWIQYVPRSPQVCRIHIHMHVAPLGFQNACGRVLRADFHFAAERRNSDRLSKRKHGEVVREAAIKPTL